MKTENKSVVIIGGGLVGSLCACFLGKRGFNVKVYESRDDLRLVQQPGGRSINLALSHRGRAALRSLGLEDEILKQAVPMKGRFTHTLPNINKSIPYDEHNNQCIYSIGRTYLNCLLLTAAEKHPNVKCYFAYKLLDLNLNQNKCLLLNLKNNEKIEEISDLIIGADGAHSTVRGKLQQNFFNISQEYIDHGYLELTIPPENGEMLAPNHLHIWPRSQYMMIALPNIDKSWTVTLFIEFKQYENLKKQNQLLDFFKITFPDSVDLIGEKELANKLQNFKLSPMLTIKCDPYHHKDKLLIVGDAAHAMVPFYGQGMNAGFEDCLIFDDLLETYKSNFGLVLEEFSARRKADVHAMCDLAKYNFVEMRDLVARPSFQLRKKIDSYMYRLFPEFWIPLYNTISFSQKNYSWCLANKMWQDKVINHVLGFGTFILGSLILLLIFQIIN